MKKSKPQIILCFGVEPNEWSEPNALATDGDGSWFLCYADYDMAGKHVPRGEMVEVSLADVCQWYGDVHRFAADSTGTLAPFLGDVARALNGIKISCPSPPA